MGPDETFSPVGLKVLVVDDDRVCLKTLETMLQQCNYTVTACDRGVEALEYLSEKNSAYDLVLCDVHMPGMDGCELLKAIRQKTDLPVIMMSVDQKVEVVMKGILHGACDFLAKPVDLRTLQMIWKHVIRRRRRGVSIRDDKSDSLCGVDSLSKKRKEREEFLDERLDHVNGLKKARVVWSGELHEQFVKAVNQLGIDKAVPKRILEIMNVEGLSRDNVASHLQKYRQNLKRLSGVSTQPHPVASFQSAQVGGFAGSMQIQPGGRGVASRGNVMNVPSSPNTTFSDLIIDSDELELLMKVCQPPRPRCRL